MYHNHSNSERTVPINPLINNNVHILEVGGNSNSSIPV